jgi:hypothetical protein
MTRRGPIGVLLAAATLALGVVACTPSSSLAASCAWSSMSGSNGGVAFPDLDATYFQLPFVLTTGQQVVIHGTYPAARYLSFTTYGADLNPIGNAADRVIAPDPGSQNPYATVVSGPPADQHYTMTIVDGAPATGASNTISGGSGSVIVGIVTMRVYLPTDPTSRSGGPLPAASVRSVDGTLRSIPQCASGPAVTGASSTPTIGVSLPISTATPPVFIRQSGASLLPNPDNAYLAAAVDWTPGKVIVVHGTAPTFPDTRHGVSPAQPSDVRYWSMCTNTDVLPLPVVACAADDSVPLDAQGRYTFVISTPEDRPATADGAHGVTWLPWGSTSHPMVMILRNMLPSPGFTAAVQDVPAGQSGASVMGDYAPVASVTTAAAFDGA